MTAPVTKERDMTHGIWELGNGQEKKIGEGKRTSFLQ